MVKFFSRFVYSNVNLSTVIRSLSQTRIRTLADVGLKYLYINLQAYNQNRKNEVQPTSMYLELTTYCWRNCKDCYITPEERNDKRLISLENVLSIIEEAKSQGIIAFTFMGGEPISKQTIPMINKILDTHPSLLFFLLFKR